MKKLFYLLMMAFCATMFTACSDDDKNDTPINGLEIPKFENPVTPGQTITIKGEGFNEGSEIWFRQIVTRATDNDDVKAEVTGVDANGITFIAPSVYGNQTVLLKQDGKEYKLGEMLFADEPADVVILSKKIKKITEVVEEEHWDEDIHEFEYDADGRIISLDFGNNEIWYYTYSDNKITCRGEYQKEDYHISDFVLENGRIKSHSWEDKDGYGENYDFEYDNEGHLSKAVMVSSDNDTETETLSFAGGNLMKYDFVYEGGEVEGWHGSMEFIYGEQMNNLNIDLFYIIGSYHFDSNIGDAFLFNLLGKRSRCLPVKMIITDPIEDEDNEKVSFYKTYTVNIEYEMDGEYISSFTFRPEGVEDDYYGTSTFVIEYED